jgi:tRNA-2-methylthio-N6-dimethylallyladenosine synthase
MKKYWITTYGCQMNHSDSEQVAAVLENIDYKKSSNIGKADLIVVNMCSVRQSAVDRIYGKIKDFSKLKVKNKKLKVILTGCILKKDKKKFKKAFDFILNIKDLPKLPKLLDTRYSTLNTESYLKTKPKYQTSFSAHIPIMTGCNNFCTYCVVPYTRGRENSRPAEEIIEEVRNLVKQGYKEIWLLGQNVNSYNSKVKNRNLEVVNFPKLLKMINDIPGDFWIRFTSSHPKDFSDELINVMAKCKKVTEYLNLPVQSGDDEIIKKMNRPYTIKQYKETVRKIREKVPDITLSTDVIVGFPGETEKQFNNTAKLFKEIKYDMAYIAKYSPRPQTAAATLENNVLKKEKKERRKILTEILKKTALERNKRYVGKTTDVLVNSKKGNFLFGKTRAYKTVKIQSKIKDQKSKIKLGQFIKVKITKALPWGLKGRLI